MAGQDKTSMSVMEMGRMLGLKKTDSYWLAHKGYFEVVMVAGRMRVMTGSFDKWYATQTHYHKVYPGKEGTSDGIDSKAEE